MNAAMAFIFYVKLAECHSSKVFVEPKHITVEQTTKLKKGNDNG